MKPDLRENRPCENGLKYYESKQSAEQAWNDCQRGDWMIWSASKLGVNEKLLLTANLKIARTVDHLMEDQRSLDMLDALEKYLAGEISRDKLEVFRADAKCVAIEFSAFLSASLSAASAAYFASIAISDDLSAAYFVADSHARSCSSNQYLSYAYADAKKENELQTANICREILTDAVMEKIK